MREPSTHGLRSTTLSECAAGAPAKVADTVTVSRPPRASARRAVAESLSETCTRPAARAVREADAAVTGRLPMRVRATTFRLPGRLTVTANATERPRASAESWARLGFAMEADGRTGGGPSPALRKALLADGPAAGADAPGPWHASP